MINSRFPSEVEEILDHLGISSPLVAVLGEQNGQCSQELTGPAFQ